jgi:chromosome segregation ATPase
MHLPASPSSSDLGRPVSTSATIQLLGDDLLSNSQAGTLKSERKGLVRALEAAEARLAEAAQQLEDADAERSRLREALDRAELGRSQAEAQVEAQDAAMQQVRGAASNRKRWSIKDACCEPTSRKGVV